MWCGQKTENDSGGSNKKVKSLVDRFIFQSQVLRIIYVTFVQCQPVLGQPVNLNIRRYVDNSPDPEPHDVRAHLLGGIPKKELESKKELLDKYGLSDGVLLKEKNGDYFEFRDEIDTKDRIKEVIEASPTVNKIEDEMRLCLNKWWQDSLPRLRELPDKKDLYNVRREFIVSIKDALLPVGHLDEFKVAGIFVNWWKDVQYELRTIISTGWSRAAIKDEHLIDQSCVSGVRNDVWRKNRHTSLVTNIMPQSYASGEHEGVWGAPDTPGQSSAKVRTDEGRRLLADISEKEERMRGLEALLNKGEDEENGDEEPPVIDERTAKKELRKLKNEINALESRRDEYIEKRRESIKDEEVAELVLLQLKEGIEQFLEQYLTELRQQIIAIYENWWDKYRVTAREIEEERDVAKAKLDGFLGELGYSG